MNIIKRCFISFIVVFLFSSITVYGSETVNSSSTVTSKYLTNTTEDVVDTNVEVINRSQSKYLNQSASDEENLSNKEPSEVEQLEDISDTKEIVNGYVSCDVLNLRETPEMVSSENIVGKLYRYESVEVISTSGVWLKITASDNRSGYVHSDYIVIVEDSDDTSELSDIREAVVEFAKQYVGLDYVYGGNSLTTGTDCSGFVQLVMKEFGYYINRTASTQANNGVYVSKDDILPGDLVFYGYGSIQHVAMYIGNGQVIHAGNESTGVFINDVYSSWNRPYITIRRIIVDN